MHALSDILLPSSPLPFEPLLFSIQVSIIKWKSLESRLPSPSRLLGSFLISLVVAPISPAAGPEISHIWSYLDG
jgi:hypothetical protein